MSDVVHTPETVKTQMQADIVAANTATGGSDTTLHDAVNTLITGFGQGGAKEEQEKTLNVTANGTYNIEPDDGKAISSATVNVNVPSNAKEEQEKTLNVTVNGEYSILPDDGKALYQATVNVDVPIPDGYIIPTGELEIIENGTHDVTNYASAVVNIGTSGGDPYGLFDSIFSHTITEFNYTKEADWTIGAGSYPGTFGNMFNACDKLQKWAVPNLTWHEVAGYMFRGCKPDTLKYIDFGKPNYFHAAAFYGFRPNGASIIIRNETVPTLRGAFTATAFTNSYFYVRSSLVDEFKVATNWATYADLFRPLEDYTVDGTASGELDMSKI